jgi:hypothetical protein
VEFQKEFLELMFKTTNKAKLTALVNQYATDEDNYCSCGNVSDTLPFEYWKFLSLYNFISNLMNNESRMDNSSDYRLVDVGPNTPQLLYNESLSSFMVDNNLIKEYCKENRAGLSFEYSFEDIMEEIVPYTQLDDPNEIMLRASNVISICEGLKIKVVPLDNSPEDWGIEYHEVDSFALSFPLPKIIRKTVIQNFAKMFKKWNWKKLRSMKCIDIFDENEGR